MTDPREPLKEGNDFDQPPYTEEEVWTDEDFEEGDSSDDGSLDVGGDEN
jgi:hypothetical protein